MKFFLPFFVLFFVAFATDNSIFLGYGYVDRMEEESAQCANFTIPLHFDEKSEKKVDFKDLCSKSRRTQRAILLPIGVAIGFGLGGGLIGGVLPPYLSHLFFRHQINVVSSEIKDLREVDKLTAEQLQILKTAQTLLSQNHADHLWEEFEDKLFEKSNIEPLFKFLKIDPMQLLKDFGIPESLGMDVFRTFTYEAQCGENFDSVDLIVCHRSSASRKIGRVVKLAPKGKFIHGRAYRYFETPNFGVITSGGIVSADTCKRFGKLYACAESSGNCTYDTPAGCNQRTVETDGTFIKEIEDFSFVATTLKKYTIRNKTKSVTKSVGESGQIFLSLPHTYHAQIGTHVIQGRHDTFEEVAIDVEESLPHMNHEEIEKFIKDHNEVNDLLSDERVKELHDSVPWKFNFDNLMFWCFGTIGKTLIVLFFVIVTLVIIFYFCRALVCNCLKKRRIVAENSIPKRNEFLDC